MKQRCLLLLSLFLATLTGAWAQLPTLGTVTGTGVNACNTNSGNRNLTIALTTSTQSIAGFYYRLSATGDGGFTDTDPLAPSPSAAAGDVFNNTTTSLTFENFNPGPTGASNVVVTLQSSPDNATWTDVGSPTAAFNVGVTPSTTPAFTITATPSVPNPAGLTSSNSVGQGVLLIASVCSDVTSNLTISITGNSCNTVGEQERQWAVTTTNAAPASGDPAWTNVQPTTQANDGVLRYYWARCVNLSPLCPGPATSGLQIGAARVVVNPTPIATQPTLNPQTICAGYAAVAFDGNGGCPGGTTTQWWREDPGAPGTFDRLSSLPATTGVAYGPAGNESKYPPINSLGGATTQTITFYASCIDNNGAFCESPRQAVVLTIKPTPGFLTQLPNITTNVCSGTALNYDIAAALAPGTLPVGTTYAWAAPVVANITGTSTRTAPGTSANLTDNLVNATNANIDVVYNVTATADGCSLDPNSKFTMTVTVKPTPKIAAKAVTICSGDVADLTLIDMSPTEIVPAGANMTYSWTVVDNPNVTGDMNGGPDAGDNVISFGALTNTSNTVQTVTYTVTATYVGPGTPPNCSSTFDVVVTVKPRPSLANQTTNICSGVALNYALAGVGADIVPANTTYSWPTPVNSNVNLIGGTARMAPGTADPITDLFTNNTNVNRTSTYTITPVADGCVGPNFTLIVNVRPTPKIANKTATICSGTAASLTLTNNQPTEIVPAAGSMTYNWTVVDNPNVTGDVAGTISNNNTINFGTLTNNTNATETVTYTVTPIYDGTGGPCQGADFTFTVTVNPTPVIAAKAFAICSEANASLTLTNGGGDIVPDAPGVNYTWMVTANAGGITGMNAGPANGTNTIDFGNLVNPTTAVQTITFQVTPTYVGPNTPPTCPGLPFNVVVTVNPKPVITNAAGSPNPGTICVAQSSTLTFDIAGAIGPDYIITYGQTAGTATPTIVASPLTGTGLQFSFIATPPSGAVGPMTYTIQSVQYTANGITCTYTNPTLNGPSQTFNVHPQPTAPVGAGMEALKIVGPDNKSETCEATGIVNLTNNATCLGANELPKWYTDAQHTAALATVPPASPFGPTSGLASPPNTVNTATGANNYGFTSPGKITWWVACLNQVTGCETPAVDHVKVEFTINPMGATPTASFTPDVVCQGPAGATTTVTLNANCGTQTPKWYTAATGGTVVSGPTYTFPSDAPTTHSLWVVCVTDKGCETVPRTKVDLLVNAAPAAPGVITLNPSSICQQEPGTPNLAIKPISDADARCVAANGAGFTGAWYAAATGGSAIANPVVDVTVWGPVTFYVACKNPVTLCESLTRQAVTFTVLRAPLAPAPITLTPGTACASTTPGAPMNNNATCTGSSGNGEANVWYSTPTGGMPLSSAPNTTPATTTTWYVACRNLTTGCESLLPRTAVTFTVFPTPTINPIVPATATYCNGAPVFPLPLSGTPAVAVAPNSAVWFRYSGGASIGLANGVTSTGLPGFNAINNTNAVVNVPITIVPYTFGPNGINNNGTGDDCLGAPFTYTITVIPTPTVTFTCPAPVCANDAFSAIAFSSPVAGTVFNWTNDNTSIGLGASGMGNIASFTGLNASTTMSNTGLLSVTPSVTVNSVTCTGPVVTCNLIVKPRPSSNLTASQTDVCPNTEVTLNPNCSIPTPISTVQWGNGAGSALPAPAGPTVTPTAPDLTYIYTAICIADGCAGNMSEATVRTHRLLVDIVKVAHPGGNVNQPGAIMEVQNDLGKDLSVPKNTIVSNDGMTPRTWNILARPCYAPVGSISFEFLGGPLPLSYKTVDNFAPHAFFANDGASTFYSQASMTYGPGSMLPFYTGGTPNFPNGIYTVLIQGRTNAVPGAIPAARNKLSGGALLSTRTVTFEVKGTNSGARIGVEEEVVDAENWLSLVQNPISEEIMVRISGNVGDNVQLNLSNLQGQEVHKSNLQLETTSQLNKINARDFSTGFYILKAVNGDKVKTIKVLKVQ